MLSFLLRKTGGYNQWKNIGRGFCLWLVTIILWQIPVRANAQGIQLSGGIDVRYALPEDRLNLEGVFLNFRKTWSDEMGDRWIAVIQSDFDDNFSRVKPYQVYLQYKGPLGKWNIRSGHFLLPFGLLATYDTERLLLQGLEKTSLGIRKDTGVEALGRFGMWDYAVSVTDGLSDLKFIDSKANPVFTGRLAYVQDDWQIGISALAGRVLIDPDFGTGDGDVRENRLAVDITRILGPAVIRAEASGGTDNGCLVYGGLVLADYALTPKMEVNSRVASWHGDSDSQSLGLGITYQIRQGLYIRLADTYDFRRKNKNEIEGQIYYEFSKMF